MRFSPSSPRPSRAFDLLVAGAGPAGSALAAAAAELGMSVALLDPAPDGAWPASYGVWADEPAAGSLQAAVESRYDAPTVWVDEPIALERSYLRLDSERLQSMMVARSARHGVQVLRGRAVGIEHDVDGSWVHGEDGARLRAAVVVDASGAKSELVGRHRHHAPTAFQTAYGELLEVDGSLYAPGAMSLMDFRGADERAPTFLYAMQRSDGLLFAEETSLVSRPGLGQRTLRERLHRRLDGLGLTRRRVVGRECCVIPMDVGLPSRDQRAVAFGAAAALVHPATGYQLSRSLQLAPVVAQALAEGMRRGPADAARDAYRAMWPADRVRAWQLYSFGLEALVRMGADSLRSFMRSFFALPAQRWRGFLDATLTPAELTSAMWTVFAGSNNSLRWELMKTSVGSGSRPLLRAFAPMTTP